MKKIIKKTKNIENNMNNNTDVNVNNDNIKTTNINKFNTIKVEYTFLNAPYLALPFPHYEQDGKTLLPLSE